MITKRYGTLRQTSETYPSFSVSFLRQLIRENPDNFSECILRPLGPGSRYLIDYGKFEEWIEATSKEVRNDVDER